METEMKYEEAMKQLEQIVSEMENGKLDIDIIGEQLQKAKKLIAFCKSKLESTDADIKKIMESTD